MIDAAQLAALYPRAFAAAIDGLAKSGPALARAGLFETADRLHFFLAQIGHESCGLTIREENLNYSAARLMAVWPSRFRTPARASPHAHAPAKLAEAVYGGRLGNSEPGDGWRYRGRGYIQLTGRAGYRAVGEIAGLDLEGDPDLAADPAHAPAVAAAYWTWRRINTACDAGDFVACTRKVNGATVGLDDRRAWLAKAQAVIPWPPEAPDASRLKVMQQMLKARGLYAGSIDGIVGRLTRAGLSAAQAEAGLPVTGEPDAATMRLLRV